MTVQTFATPIEVFRVAESDRLVAYFGFMAGSRVDRSALEAAFRAILRPEVEVGAPRQTAALLCATVEVEYSEGSSWTHLSAAIVGPEVPAVDSLARGLAPLLGTTVAFDCPELVEPPGYSFWRAYDADGTSAVFIGHPWEGDFQRLSDAEFEAVKRQHRVDRE